MKTNILNIMKNFGNEEFSKTSKKNKNAFTLIELLVAIVISSILIISLFTIFSTASMTNYKIESDRVVQENVKNLIENMAENIRKHGIEIESTFDGTKSGKFEKLPDGTQLIELKLNGGIKYRLMNVNDPVPQPVTNLSQCESTSTVINICTIFYNDLTINKPLLSNTIRISNVSFNILKYGNSDKRGVNAVLVNFDIGYAPNKGVSNALVENSKIRIQTTLSERFIKYD